MPSLRLGFLGLPDTPMQHLSVDGMSERGPNLSHWPGNRTPLQWKRDLSTGIALAFARADVAERSAFLAGADTVLNDHYDTDGFGALLAVLRPEVAFAREELLLAAAATGDFGTFLSWRGFAVDRIVVGLASADSPSAAEFADLPPAQRSLRRYQWLIENAEQVLDRPQTLAVLYERELAQQLDELDRARRGALQRRLHTELGFSVVQSHGPMRRMTVNTLAGAYRILHVQVEGDGVRYRFHDRTESWFELVTLQPLPRRDLTPLARRLQALEGDDAAVRWCADPPTEPIPELYCGVAAAQEYGQVTRQLLPSRLAVEQVEREFAAFFTAPEPR